MTIETQDLTRQICDLKDEPLIKDMREDAKVVFRPVVTAIERAKEWFRKPHGVMKAVEATKIVHDLLAECEGLKEEIAGFPNVQALRVCMLETADENDRLKADARVMAEAIGEFESLIAQSSGVDGLHLNGDIAPWGDLHGDGRYSAWLSQLSAACEVGRKYMGGENE
jgi:hypothetical protein